MLAQMGIQRRLRQIVPPARPALWLPLDDSLISGPERALRRPSALLVPEIVENLTAVLAFRGTLTACQRELASVPIIMNLSASTVRGEHTRKVPVGSVTDAVRAGAQAVAFHVNHRSPFEAEALQELSRLASASEDVGIPLIAIAYPRGRNPDGSDENYLQLRADDEGAFAALVRHCVRVAVELGACAVKTVYTGSVESFATVVSAAMGVPVVVAGERLVDASEAIAKAQAAVRAGAAGVAYGRQVFHRDEPAAFVQKLHAALDDAWVERMGMPALAVRRG